MGGTDISLCMATQEADKIAILEHASNGVGGIAAVNDNIREITKSAMDRACIMAIATAGDVQKLQAIPISSLIDWRSTHGGSASHVAASHSKVAALLEIVEKTCSAHVHLKDNDGRTPLSIAAGSGALASVMSLLSLQASLETRCKHDLTPLHHAAAGGFASVVRLLLESQADAEANGFYLTEPNWRASGIAAYEGHAAVIGVLASHGADLDAVSGVGGCTPLHFAVCLSSGADVVGMLVVSMASVDNLGGPIGRTPLMMACKIGHPSAVLTLVGARADLAARDRDSGLMCLDYLEKCRDVGRREQIRRLLERYPLVHPLL